MKFDVKTFLAENVMPATGCTEPIAVAYATSLAYSALFGIIPNQDSQQASVLNIPNLEDVVEISITTDRDVFKNALAISIPGTSGQKGITIASAMGLFCDPYKGLNLFENVSGDTLKKANDLLASNKIVINKVEDTSDESDLDIKVKLTYLVDSKNLTYSIVRLQGQHDNITKINVDGKDMFTKDYSKGESVKSEFPGTLKELVSIADNLTNEEIKLAYEGITMNLAISSEGSKNDYGLNLGKTIKKLTETGVLSKNSLVQKVKATAAHAGDARMGGANMPVMSTSGSGNQGITALIPIAVVGKYQGISEKTMAKAAMLSHLVTKYVSNHSGYLSGICGCAIKAGIGATAGVAYMISGDIKVINNAINIMAANITGMICDGAKEGCALKLSTAAGTATESAFMAKAGMYVPGDNGIIYSNAEDTMIAIGKITQSMVPTDVKIVEIMQDK